MKISLAGAWRRALLLALVLLVAGGMAYSAGKIWFAAHWDASSNPDLWFRAARLEPGNAEYWRHLGFFEQWDFERGDPYRAVQYFQRATEVDPYSDINWMSLASAYETRGQVAQAREAFERAQASHPNSAEVAWRYGSFLLRQEDFPGASVEIRRALLQDPKLTASAVSQCSQAGQGVSRIIEDVLPARSDYFLAALDYFVSKPDAEAGLAVWERLLRLQQPFQLSRALPFLDELIRQDRFEEAPRVWRQVLQASGWPQDASANTSFIFDGGFEHDLVNGGFGWREQPVSGASFDFDPSVFHSGKRSLRVAFDGTGNVDFSNLYQYVAVEPRRRYRFTAYLRTQEISTDSGMRFLIYDLRHPDALNVRTPNLLETQPWSPAEAEFITGAETHWLAVVLRRFPSWHFDNKLRGTVWVDDVSLVPLPAESKGGPP